jgi:hypothetical protein
MTKRLAEAVAVLRELPDSIQDAAAEVLVRYINERLQLEAEFGQADRDIHA